MSIVARGCLNTIIQYLFMTVQGESLDCENYFKILNIFIDSTFPTQNLI